MNIELAVILSFTTLLVLMLRYKVHAFLSILIACLILGILGLEDPMSTFNSIQKGLGGTLGFVGVIVGLGSFLGAVLQHTGGIELIANRLIQTFGIKRSPIALLIAGLIISIPVFFDVAFILLIPLIKYLSNQNKGMLLRFALPFLIGISIAHAFIPPTPGPVAVADLLQVSVGAVIFWGILVAVPTALITFVIANRFLVFQSIFELGQVFFEPNHEASQKPSPNAWAVFVVIFLPLFLMILGAFSEGLFGSGTIARIVEGLGHPFIALTLANILAYPLLAKPGGFSKTEVNEFSSASLKPVGIILLVTGIGGAFKQLLIDTGIGSSLAEKVSSYGFSVIVLAFVLAAIVRLLQGSTTVAMITSAGLIAPMVTMNSSVEGAMIVLAVASGSLIFSHFNDSGFWLVSRYLNLTEKETVRSWSLMTLTLSLVSFGLILILWQLFV
ncbi:MAG: gluconate:H+ symporter [Flavobacteriaceae bacterium]